MKREPVRWPDSSKIGHADGVQAYFAAFLLHVPGAGQLAAAGEGVHRLFAGCPLDMV
jgi:hypothetical protein